MDTEVFDAEYKYR